jgi:hypothetical protein
VDVHFIGLGFGCDGLSDQHPRNMDTAAFH